MSVGAEGGSCGAGNNYGAEFGLALMIAVQTAMFFDVTTSTLLAYYVATTILQIF